MSACTVPGCLNQSLSAGLCSGHRQRREKWGDVRADIPLGQKNRIGNAAELRLAQLLKNFGRQVKIQRYKAPFDLLIDGKWRVEVKCAAPQIVRGVPCWRFNIHRHGKISEHTDLYILRLEKVPYAKYAIHLLLPAPIKKSTITVSFRSLMNGASVHAHDFYSFARGEFSPSGVAA